MYIFVYGSLKLQCSNHDNIKNAKFVCASKTEEMYMMLDVGLFPGVVKSVQDPTSIDQSQQQYQSHINGEVYEIDYDTIKYLDKFEGIWFTREMVPLECGISAWMYFLNAMPDEYEIIESGMWEN